MSRRVVTPSDGSVAVTFTWDHSEITVPAGTLVEAGPGSELEAAFGLENLTKLAGPALVADQTGSGQATTSNA